MPIYIPSPPLGSPPNFNGLCQTHTQPLLARGQGQKLINQILLSAVKPLSLPACILNKTALKYINTQTDTHPKHGITGQKHQARLRFGTVQVCVCMCVQGQSQQRAQMDGRENSNQTKPGGQAPSPSLSLSFDSPFFYPLLHSILFSLSLFLTKKVIYYPIFSKHWLLSYLFFLLDILPSFHLLSITYSPLSLVLISACEVIEPSLCCYADSQKGAKTQLSNPSACAKRE